MTTVKLFDIVARPRFIKNMKIPSCKNCYFFDRKKSRTYLEIPKCTKFGVKNIVTGDITYDSANDCRQDANKCGIVANYYIPNSVSHSEH